MNPRPPRHLKAATRRWFAAIVDEYDLEDHHVKLLVLAAEAWDRAEQARQILATEGVTYSDRFGAPRVHPAVTIERDSRLAFARLIREIDLEGEPRSEPRPPRRR